MRSLLTMLGIIIGIAAIIAIVSTIRGTNEQIKKNLIGSGTNTVNVRLSESGDWDYEMEYGTPEGVPVLDSETRDTLADLDNVLDASLYTVRNSVDYIYYNAVTLQGGQLIGADIHYMNTCGYIMAQGRNFLESDYENYRKVAVVDQTAADSLFGEDSPIGKTIDIKGEPFIVVGLMEESSKYEPVINSVDDYNDYVYDNVSSGMVVIPDTVWNVVEQYDEPQNVKLLANSTDNMSSVGKAAANLLNESVTNSQNIAYRAEDITEKAAETEELTRATNNQLIWIAGISLLVGGIGVMNIMLVSVTERTKEIGLKKAIGARKNKILVQFLTEAAMLTIIGGAIGVVAGIIAAQVIARISGVPVAISIPSIFIALVFSMAIGIVFGFVPSVQAANLDPIVALRRE